MSGDILDQPAVLEAFDRLKQVIRAEADRRGQHLKGLYLVANQTNFGEGLGGGCNCAKCKFEVIKTFAGLLGADLCAANCAIAGHGNAPLMSDVDIRGRGESFYLRHGGRDLPTRYWNYDSAVLGAAKVEAENRKRRWRNRPCLCCQADFTSEGPHHRLCNTCRDLS